MASPKIAQEIAKVSTILTLEERIRVDAAGTGLYLAQHRTEPTQVLADVKSQTSSCVLLSVRYCEQGRWEQMSRLIREISRIPTVAILSEESPDTVEMLLRLGREGVQQIVDVRSPQGWKRLRNILVDERSDWIEQIIVSRLKEVAGGMTRESWRFFETLIRHSARVGSVRELAEVLEILPSTLMSRFYRAALPAPKRYLAVVRLIRAAYLCENSGFSVANVANHLEYSSPQSFGRHVRSMMGLTAVKFRREFNGSSMLELFEHELVRPYRQVLDRFQPFSGGSANAPSANHAI